MLFRTSESVSNQTESFGRAALRRGRGRHGGRPSRGALAVAFLLFAAASLEAATGAGAFTVERPRPRPGVVKAADYGFSAARQDNAAAINRALAACRRTGAGRLVLAPGIYDCFDAEGVTVASCADLTLDGRGAVLVFRRPPRAHANERQYDVPVAGANFVFSNCTRVALENVKIDWDWAHEPLADFATILAVHEDPAPNASYIDFKMADVARHPQYPNPVPLQTINGMTPDHLDRRLSAPLGGFYGTSEGHFGAKNAWVAPNVLRVWPNVKLAGRRYQPLYDARFSPRENAASVRRAARDIGGTYRLVHCYYGPNAVNTHACRHLTFAHVDVWSAYGMGFRTTGAQEYWQYLDCHVRLPPADLRRADGSLYAPYRRGVTVTADAHHVVQSKGHVKFVDCSWTLHQDDTHNFHDRSTLVIPAGTRQLAVVNGRGAEYFGAAPGDAIELVREDFSRLGWKGRIVSVAGDVYTVDRDVPPLGDDLCLVAFNASYGTDFIVLENCTMANTLSARNLIHGSNVTVEGCRFRNITGAPLKFQIEYTWNAWCEGFGCTNVLVKGCTFENDSNGYLSEGLSAEIFAAARPAPNVESWIRIDNPHVAAGLARRRAANFPGVKPCREILSDLTVTGCRFLNPRGLVLQAERMRGVAFRDNEIVFDKPPFALLPYAGGVLTEDCTEVDVARNRYVGRPDPGLLSRRLLK